MVTENIQISIRETGGRRVVAIMGQIDRVADRASDSIKRLKANLQNLNVAGLTKLTNAQAKLIASIARETNANTRALAKKNLVTQATTKQTILDTRAASVKQKLAADTSRAAVSATKEVVALKGLEKATIQTTAAGLRLEQQQRRLARSMNTTRRSGGLLRAGTLALARAFAFIGAIRVVTTIVELGDTYTNLQNRLGLVTKSSEELNDVTERLFETANKTRSSFASTGELYARVALSTKQLGLTQAQTISFTKSLNQAIILSGASAAEASNGVIQLAQGLASNRLSGDELRSVLEQLPLVADTIAKSLGITRGELRKFGSEGKISAASVIKAFLEAEKELNDKFGKTVSTVAQGWTIFLNGLTKGIAAFNEGTGASAIFAKALAGLGKSIGFITEALFVSTIAIIAYKAQFRGTFLGGAIIRVRLMTRALLLQALAWKGLSATAARGVLLQLGSIAKLRLGILALTGAVLKFSAALLLNPIFLIAAVIAGIIASFTIWRERIKVTSDGLVTLGDVMRETGERVAFAFNAILNFVGPSVRSAISDVTDLFDDLSFSLEDIGLLINRVADDVFGAFVAIGQVIKVFFTDVAAFVIERFRFIALSIKDAVIPILTAFDFFDPNKLGLLDKFNSFIKDASSSKSQQAAENIKNIGQRLKAAFALGIDSPKLEQTFQEFMDNLRSRSGKGGDEAAEAFSQGWFDTFNERFTDGLAAGRNKILTTFRDISKQIENLMVNAFNRMADALTDFVLTGKFDFKSFADSVIKDMIRIAIQQVILGPLLKGGQSFTPTGGAQATQFAPSDSLTGVGSNTPVTQITQAAHGGLIGGTGGSKADDKIIAASSGEFVVNAASTKRFLPLINAINNSEGRSGQLKAPRTVSPQGGLGGGSAIFAPVINITVEGVESEEQGERQAEQLSKSLLESMKQQMAAFVQQQQRNGGILNAQREF